MSAAIFWNVCMLMAPVVQPMCHHQAEKYQEYQILDRYSSTTGIVCRHMDTLTRDINFFLWFCKLGG